MITDQDTNMIYRGYRYASGSQSTGWTEPLPNQVLFYILYFDLKNEEIQNFRNHMGLTLEVKLTVSRNLPKCRLWELPPN